jgi:hypothetical protein
MDVIDQDYLWIVSTSVSSVERHNCFYSSVINYGAKRIEKWFVSSSCMLQGANGWIVGSSAETQWVDLS